MTTLAEIESAASRLPLEQQEELLRELAKQVRSRRVIANSTQRTQWMAGLQVLRDSIGVGNAVRDSEQILTELREERV